MRVSTSVTIFHTLISLVSSNRGLLHRGSMDIICCIKEMAAQFKRNIEKEGKIATTQMIMLALIDCSLDLAAIAICVTIFCIFDDEA